jgi:glycosyltransferase involved in cell wall biosynthesis
LRSRSVLFVEPYDGGSHRAFRTGLQRWSRHAIDALTLPPRFWKWRMRGSAAHFADLVNRRDEAWEALLVTSYVNLADLRGLLAPPRDRLPAILYFHENQLTYPLSPEEEFDFHFGFTNILSALAADRVVFNSAFQRDLFLDSLPDYLARMPEAVPRRVRERLAARSEALPVGLEREPHPAGTFAPYRGGPCDRTAGPPWPRDGRAPVLLWNHRWEFDKRPDLFRDAVSALHARDLPFSLLLLGEPRGHEEVFAPLRETMPRRILAWGGEPDRARYEAWLARADVGVSCAEQEYFGIAVAEAVHAGAYPVLPRRQVYPSLYGRRCRGRHLYATAEDLVGLLAALVGGGDCGHVCSLELDMDEFCWRRLAPRYDALIDATVAAAGAGRFRGPDLALVEPAEGGRPRAAGHGGSAS